MSADARHSDLQSMEVFTFLLGPCVKLRAVLVKLSTMVGCRRRASPLRLPTIRRQHKQTTFLLLLSGVVCQRAGYGVSGR
jgi:hypothetical protein